LVLLAQHLSFISRVLLDKSITLTVQAAAVLAVAKLILHVGIWKWFMSLEFLWER